MFINNLSQNVLFLFLINYTLGQLNYIPDPPKDMKPAFERVHKGRLYMIFNARPIWWLMGQRLCERYQGQLAVPQDEETYKFIVHLIRDYYAKLNFTERERMYGFHVGVRYVENRWIPENIDWCSGEPKAHGSCAEFSTKHGFCMNDFKCTENRRRAIICETPLFVMDQPERGLMDQRVICMKAANFTEAQRRSTWYEAEKWCRTLGMFLVHPSIFLNKQCLHKKAPTAIDSTLLDGIWNTDKQIRWCRGHPLPNRYCALQLGNCYRSVRCQDNVMQRFCCSAMAKKEVFKI